MPDPILPVTPTEPATPPTPELTTPKTGDATEPSQEQPVYVTREELDRIIAQTKSEVRQADKQRAKQIKAEMNALKESLTASGIQVTPQQEAILQEKVEQRLDIQQESPTGDDISAEDIPPEVQQSIAMMNKRGVIVREADPEFKQFLQPVLDSGDLSDLNFATVQAIQAKQARQLQTQQQANLRTPTGGGEPPGATPAKSASDYWNVAYKK